MSVESVNRLPVMIVKIQEVSVLSNSDTPTQHQYSINTVWVMCRNASRDLIYPALLYAFIGTHEAFGTGGDTALPNKSKAACKTQSRHLKNNNNK